MPAATSRLALPYPIPDDSVDVPRDVQALAAKLDPSVAVDTQGTFAARPAAAVSGRYYYATDAATLYRDTGTAWVPVGPLPKVTTLPVTAADGQQVIWTPNYSTMNASNLPHWHMIFNSGDGNWYYLGGAAAHTLSIGAWTYAPTTSTVNKADPQPKFSGNSYLVLPNSGIWRYSTSGVAVRTGGSSAAVSFTFFLGFARDWLGVVNLIGREQLVFDGPSDGRHCNPVFIHGSGVAGEAIGLIVQGSANPPAGGYVIGEQLGTRMELTPERVTP
jgi:hypothetical protein